MTIRFIEEEPKKIRFIEEEIQPVRKQGYFNQITQGSPERQNEMQRISNEYGAGDITGGEYVFQNLGEAAGNIGDVVGRGIGDAVGLAGKLIPQPAKDYMSQYTQPIGQAVAPALQSISDTYGDVKQAYPRIMENVEAGTNIALLGAGGLGRAGGITGAVERGGKSIAQKFTPNLKALSSDDLREIGGQLFKVADEKGGILKPEITNKFIDNISKELPQTDIGRILEGDNEVTSMLGRVQQIRDVPMTLEAAKEVDEILGKLAYKTTDSFGKMGDDGRRFLNMQSSFRNAIENADESMVVGGKDGFNALKDARKYWATSLRLRDIEKIIDKGMRSEQPQTSIKNGFKSLLNSKKITQYSPAEVRAIEIAANKGTLTDILGNFGSRLNPQITGGVAAISVDPMTGLAVYLGQTTASGVARKMATGIQKRKAAQVENLIRQRVGDASGQKFNLTPEIKSLMTELGISSLPAGGVDALLNELQMIQQSGTIQSQEE